MTKETKGQFVVQDNVTTGHESQQALKSSSNQGLHIVLPRQKDLEDQSKIFSATNSCQQIVDQGKANDSLFIIGICSVNECLFFKK